MAAQIGKFAAQKLLKNQMKKYEGKKVEGGDDPYFAMIEDSRRPGKLRKVKKQIPAYIPEHDALILASVRKAAYRLDMSLFSFLGIRFGWEAVIGLVPMAGDAVGVALAFLLFQKACTIDGGLPNTLRTRMLINIVLDFALGLVPFLGDLADAAFKCNTKNLRLLEVHLDQKYRPQATRRDARDDVGGDQEKRRRNRASGIYYRDDPPPATVFEEFSDDEDERRDFVRQQRDTGRVQQPLPTRAPEERKGGERSGGGWLSGARQALNKNVEMAQSRDKYRVGRQETGSVRL